MTEVSAWQVRREGMSRRWRDIAGAERAGVARDLLTWESRLRRMRERQRDLMAVGGWRGGPRSLLAALGLQYRELTMTAGLAWSLRPDGHHGLGSALLEGLLARLDDPITAPDFGVRVVLEEQRGDTRADLVLYASTWTVVVEAKTFAGEQDEQLDRLHDHWQYDPAPRFVFLTRGAREMTSAHRTADAWQLMTWQDVAVLLRSAVRAAPRPSPGVLDYLTTLEAYHRV
jgi:hypothetical protein